MGVADVVAEPAGTMPGRGAAAARSQRGAAIAALSSVVVIGGLIAIVVTSPGWADGQGDVLVVAGLQALVPGRADGFWLDVKLFMVVEVVVLVLGPGDRARPRPRAPPRCSRCGCWPSSTPTCCAACRRSCSCSWSGFGVPALELSGVPTTPSMLGGAALALSYSAYVAEVYRAGIRSVHPSQRAAALALGLTETQALRHVILPQAVRRVVPPLLNDFIALQKDVALVSILGPLEAFRVAQIDASSNFNYTPLLAAACCTCA